MEFISAEEFLKQDKEVQEVFINWWKPSIGDLVFVDFEYAKSIDIIINTDGREMLGNVDAFNKEDIICPILTEGLLRNFIEDKTECIVSVICEDYENTYGYKIIHGFGHYDYKENSDLLQAYWQVAVKIASGEVNNKG